MNGLAQGRANGGSLGSANQAQAPVRGSHIGNQHTRLEDNVTQLANGVELLEQRLSSVLREIQPAPQNPNSIPERDYLVPLADNMRRANDALEMMNHRLQSILDRIEL